MRLRMLPIRLSETKLLRALRDMGVLICTSCVPEVGDEKQT